MDMDDVLADKYIRIAELSEQIERISILVNLHSEQGNNQSMIRQYTYRRDELITELQTALQSLHLNVQLVAA